MGTVGKESCSETAEGDNALMPISDVGAKLALDRIMGTPRQEILNGVPQPNTLTPQPQPLRHARRPPSQPQAQRSVRRPYGYAQLPAGVSSQMRQPALPQEEPAQIPDEPQESKLKDIWDSFIVSLKGVGYQFRQYGGTVVPVFLNRDIDAKRLTQTSPDMKPLEGVDVDLAVSKINEKAEPAKQRAIERYEKTRGQFLQWFKDHPEMKPREEYDISFLEAAKTNPKLLKDLAYWFYVMARNAAPTVVTLAVAGVATALGGPKAGLAAGFVLSTPLSSAELYDTLLEAGATPDRAAELAVPIGSVIGALESVGELPILNRIAPATAKTFVKGVAGGLGKRLLKAVGEEEISEIVTENLQQIVSNAAKRAVDGTTSLIEGLDETTVETAISTLPWAALGGGIEATGGITPEMRAKMKKTAQSEAGFVNLFGNPEDPNVQPTSTPLTPEEVAIRKQKFIDIINSDEMTRAQASREALKANENKKRFSSAAKLYTEAIANGDSVDVALDKSKSALKGTMQTESIKVGDLLHPQVVAALYQDIENALGDDYTEKLSTINAFERFIDMSAGEIKALPRTPGTAGGSAYSRFMKVWGNTEIMKLFDNPEILQGDLLAGDILGVNEEALDAIPGNDMARQLEMFPENQRQEIMDAFKERGVPLAEISNLMRTTLTIGDFSYTFRQLARLVFAKPEKYLLPALKHNVLAFFSEQYARDTERVIKQNKYYQRGRDAGLHMNAWGKKVDPREETSLSNILKRVPLLGQLIKASERAANTSVNKLRSDRFYQYCQLIDDAVRIDPSVDAQTFSKWTEASARLAETETGRGNVKSLNNAMPFLTGMMFSPRYQLSVLQYVPRALTAPAPIRKEAITSAIRFHVQLAALITGITALINAAGGDASAEDDPLSSDYGKIKIGSTRLDLTAGTAAWIRVIYQLAKAQRKSTTTGEIYESNRWDLAFNFLRTKLSPQASLLVDLLKGQTMIGEEVFDSPTKELYERLMPLAVQDVIEAIKEQGVAGGLAAVPGIFGVGVVTYPDKEFANWEKVVGKNADRDALKGLFKFDMQELSSYYALPKGESRDYYLTENPESEAALYFWGLKREITNPKAWAMVQQRLQQFGISEDAYPIREPILEWSAKGKNEKQLYSEILESTPKSVSDYIVKNRDEYPVEDLLELIPKWKLKKQTDDVLIDKYKRSNLGGDTATRLTYRMTHPELDAALALWGSVESVQSGTAYQLLQNWCEELGIPADSIPALVNRVRLVSSGARRTNRAILGSRSIRGYGKF